MNDIAKTNTQMKLAIAMQREDLTQSEAAEALELPVLYIGCIRNKNRWDKVPDKRWEQVLRWVNSGQSLKEYAVKHGRVMPEKYEEKKEEAGKKLAEDFIAGETEQKRKDYEADILRKNIEKHKEKAPEKVDMIENLQCEINGLRSLISELQTVTQLMQDKPANPNFPGDSQKFAIDLEINILINGKKFSLS